MRIAWGVMLVAGMSSVAAAAPQPKPKLVFVTATATSAMPGYDAWNVIDISKTPSVAWCGKVGVGDAVTLTFAEPIAVSRVELDARFTPANAADGDYAQLAAVTVTTDAQTAPGVVTRPSKIVVPLAPTPIRSLKIAIDAVTPGKKTQRACVQTVNLYPVDPNAESFHYLIDVDRAAYTKLVAFATALDAAFRSCDPAGFGAAVQFPIKHTHSKIAVTEEIGPANTVETLHSAAELIAACRRFDSALALGQPGGTIGTTLADALAGPYCDRPGLVRLGDWDTHYWLAAFKDGAWKLTESFTSTSDADQYSAEAVVDGEVQALRKGDRDFILRYFTPTAKVVLLEGTPGLVAPERVRIALPALANDKNYETSAVASTMSRDRQSAVLSYAVKLDGKAVYRVSDVLVRSDDGWLIAVSLWSAPQSNAAVNKAALAAGGKLPLAPLAPADVAGDAEVRDAWLALQSGPIDKTAAARKDLVVIGSGPGERTVGGAAFARPWLGWINHFPLMSGLIAQRTPSGTTGWILADAALDKSKPGGAADLVPFRILFVFDKQLDGSWSLIHVHLATPPVAP